jgi:hypothetical protein
MADMSTDGNAWQVIEIVPFEGDSDQSLPTREMYRTTSLRYEDGVLTERGERWDDRVQRYRPTKSLPVVPNAIQKISVEFAE